MPVLACQSRHIAHRPSAASSGINTLHFVQVLSMMTRNTSLHSGQRTSTCIVLWSNSPTAFTSVRVALQDGHDVGGFMMVWYGTGKSRSARRTEAAAWPLIRKLNQSLHGTNVSGLQTCSGGVLNASLCRMQGKYRPLSYLPHLREGGILQDLPQILQSVLPGHVRGLYVQTRRSWVWVIGL